jgi:hypothetical protein
MANIAEQRSLVEAALKDARFRYRQNVPGPEKEKAGSDVQAATLKLADLQEKQNDLRLNARKQGEDNRAKFDKQLFDAWTAREKVRTDREAVETTAATAAAAAEQQHKYKLAEQAAATEGAFVTDKRKQLFADREGAMNAVNDLGMLKALSAAAGTSTPLEQIRVGDRTARDWLQSFGMGTQAMQEKWGAQQALESAINKTVIQLRSGVSMGQLSDRDMNFLTKLAPDMLQSRQTRADIIAYLEQAQYRKMQYVDEVERLHDGGKGLSYGQALIQAQKNLPDYVPKVPPEYRDMSKEAKLAYLQQNFRPGQLIRNLDGDLSRVPGGEK